MLVQVEIDEVKPVARLALRIPDGARILIACEDEFLTQKLMDILGEAGLFLDSVTSMTAACDLARSGRFQVIVCTPELSDGSWRRLLDVAKQYDLGFEVILLIGSSHFSEWNSAIEEGVFEVLDTAHELPKTLEVIQHALWASYLKGTGPRPRTVSPLKAA